MGMSCVHGGDDIYAMGGSLINKVYPPLRLGGGVFFENELQHRVPAIQHIRLHIVGTYGLRSASFRYLP